DLEHHRHPQPEADDLAPLVHVPGIPQDLAEDPPGLVDAGVARLADRRAHDADLDVGADFGMATPSGERPARDIPGPRTMASTIRRSSSSSPGISSTIWPRDMTRTRSHRPASSRGSLDFTSRAAPASVRARSA